jgi:PAS domain-containing protein
MKIRFLLAYADSFQVFNDYPILSATGVILLLLLIVFCILYIRSKKENIEKNNRTNEWMTQVLKSIPDMVVVFDSKQNIVDILNPLENILLGLKPEKIKGTPMRNLGSLHPAFSSAGNLIADHVEKTAVTQKNQTFEYEVIIDGSTHYAVCHTSPFMDNQVICYVHDNTYYIEAEKKSTELKSFFQSIVDNIPVGLLVKDISNELRYVFFNNYLLDFFGNENPFS